MSRHCLAYRCVISLVTVIAFVALQIPTAAFAQNSAQAEVLFKEGQQLIADKKYAEACQRLAASFKLDPQPNTELLQGECYKNLKKTASAYNAYLDASTNLARGSDAQKYAADQAKAMEPQLLKVRVQVTPMANGLTMKFDDDAKTRDKDFVGIDIALDPGEHDVTVAAPGKHDFTKHFTLDTTNSPHTIVVNLTDKTKEELDAEAHTGGGGGQVIVEKPETQWSTVKTLGLIGIIVGGAGVAGAIVAQILALVDQSNATNLQDRANGSGAPGGCLTLSPPPNAPNPNNTSNTDCNSAVSYHAQALSSQTAAIAVGIAGGVVLIAGIVLYLVGGNVEKAPEKKASVQFLPLVSPNFAGVGLTGTF